MPDIEPFPVCLLMTRLPGYHTLYYYNQGAVKRSSYRSLATIFSEGKQICYYFIISNLFFVDNLGSK